MFTRVQVSETKIDLSSLLQDFQIASSQGAANSFFGLVRDFNVGRNVKHIEYDSHQELCRKVFLEIIEESRKKWESHAHILVHHRVGRVEIGEASLAVVVSTKHRDESYRISRYIVEEIKQRAPIWKKEFYEDGESDWVQGHALCQHNKVDHENIGSSFSGR